MFLDNFQEMDLCFLLDIDYFGKVFRFSTVPIDLDDTLTGDTVRYDGGLSDPDITQATGTGLNIEGDSIAIEVTFNDIDWVAQWLSGRPLDNAPASLYAIPVQDGKTSYTIQERISLFKGKVNDPIIGDPAKARGHAAFSIENSLLIKEVKLIEEKKEITRNRFPSPREESIYGKIAPIVFGEPGIISKAGVSKKINFIKKYPITPAYRVYYRETINPYTENHRFLIASHSVRASVGRIYDKVGGSFRNPILEDVDDEGNLYSYINYRVVGLTPDVLEYDDFQTSTGTGGGGIDLWTDYYASWGEEDGGFFEVYTEGAMKRAGDICLYFLDKAGLEYNYSAWSGLLPVLNRYEFAGYIDDYEVSTWEWLKTNIIQYLPIEVINGENGLTPKLNLYFYSQHPKEQYHITASGQFEIITGIQPLEMDIINHLTVKFGYSCAYGSFQSTIIIDPRLEEDDAMKINDPIAEISYQRFGLRESVLELPFVWDLGTAFRIARDTIRYRGLGAKGIEVSATPRYSYVEVGDIVSLSSDIGLENHKCQVVSKSWDSGRWRFVLHIEDNPLINPRG
jgi:hypothetical protein